jgi:hypothetical protein
MSETTTAVATQPDWMKGFQPAPVKPKGNPAWVRGGKSPNPAGRPKGIVDRRTKVTQALEGDAPAIARVVVDAALEGDLQAASLVLSRIAPTLRAQSQPVCFAFDASAPLARQMEQVLAAIASGEVPPDVGQQIISAVEALGSLRAVEDLEQRIAQLEEKRA